MVPLAMTVGTFGAAWWYVVIHNAPAAARRAAARAPPAGRLRRRRVRNRALKRRRSRRRPRRSPRNSAAERPVKTSEPRDRRRATRGDGLSCRADGASAAGQGAREFYEWFWGFAVFSRCCWLIYYWRMDGEQFEILKELAVSVVPLGVLTIVVLAVILFGICHRDRVGGNRRARRALSRGHGEVSRAGLVVELVGAIIGIALGLLRGDFATLVVSGRWARCLSARWCRGSGSADLAGAQAESQGSRYSSQPRPRRWCAGCSSARRCSPASSRCTVARD